MALWEKKGNKKGYRVIRNWDVFEKKVVRLSGRVSRNGGGGGGRDIISIVQLSLAPCHRRFGLVCNILSCVILGTEYA